jgi:hypothetical protein
MQKFWQMENVYRETHWKHNPIENRKWRLKTKLRSSLNNNDAHTHAFASNLPWFDHCRNTKQISFFATKASGSD